MDYIAPPIGPAELFEQDRRRRSWDKREREYRLWDIKYRQVFPDSPLNYPPLVEIPPEFKKLLLEVYYELRDLPSNLWEEHLTSKLQRLYSQHKLPMQRRSRL